MARQEGVRRGAVTYDDIDDQDDSGQGKGEDDRDPVEIQTEERLARKVGWVPRSEWTRAAERWTPAGAYLDQHLRKVGELSEELRRSNAAAAAAIDEANARRRKEAEAEIDAAVEAGDTAAAKDAARRLAQSSKPPTLVEDWLRRNPWFDSDPEAKAVAVAVSNKMRAQGVPIAEELEASERRVRELFPHLFSRSSEPLPAARTHRDEDEDDEDKGVRRGSGASFSESDLLARERKPPAARQAASDSEGGVRMSEARRPVRRAPVVEDGSRGAAPRRGQAKGFADLPRAVRDTFETKFRPRGVDPEKYAQRYFGETE